VKQINLYSLAIMICFGIGYFGTMVYDFVRGV
jgi:hypothetical protein